MKTTYTICTFIAAMLATSASSTEVTRNALLKDSPVPEKREFPLSTKISPCKNFHEYVCHEAQSKFKLPANRSAWTFSFSDSHERLLHAKKQYFRLLKQGAEAKNEHAKQLKPFFLACMNEGARKKEEIERVAKEKEILKITDRADLLKLIAARQATPDYNFLDNFMAPDQADPSRYDYGIYTEPMTLPEQSYYEKPQNLKDLQNLAIKLFTEIKLDRASERAKWVMEFERDLAKISPRPAEQRERFTQDRYVKREDWLKKYPNLQLEALLNKIPSKTRLRDMGPESMEYVNKALAEMPVEKLTSIVLFHSLKDVMDDSYPSYFKTYFAFQKKHFGGPDVRPDREERCTRLVMRNFGMELDEELIDILFPNFPQDRVVKMAEKIRGSIQQGIKVNAWLSEGARKEALKKIKDASMMLVKPTREQDWDFLPIAKYDDDKPLNNLRRVAQANIDKDFKELAEKRNQKRWSMSPMAVNAYYSAADNKFVMLQGILQYPFFASEMSDIANIGAIGSVVGHELGHGIDDKGSKYDANGKLRTWMTEEDLKNFRSRGEAFIAQFNKIKHDGKLTLGENIADHVGLTFAYNTAFPDTDKVTVEQQKEFFVAFARSWCEVERPAHRAMTLKTDTHATGDARVNEQVIHQDAFYQAYQCKPGDKMFLAKEKRIRVW